MCSIISTWRCLFCNTWPYAQYTIIMLQGILSICTPSCWKMNRKIFKNNKKKPDVKYLYLFFYSGIQTKSHFYEETMKADRLHRCMDFMVCTKCTGLKSRSPQLPDFTEKVRRILRLFNFSQISGFFEKLKQLSLLRRRSATDFLITSQTVPGKYLE